MASTDTICTYVYHACTMCICSYKKPEGYQSIALTLHTIVIVPAVGRKVFDVVFNDFDMILLGPEWNQIF